MSAQGDLLAIHIEKFPSSLCAQTDSEVFFPEKGGTNRQAKLVCAQCIHKVECGEDAIERKERFGVWGGIGERERRRIIRERNPAAA